MFNVARDPDGNDSMKKRLFVSIAIVAALAAWVLTDRDRSLYVLNSAVKTLNPRVVEADIEYGELPWQKLDVYPALEKGGPSPVLIFVHGGGWYHGRKDQYFFAADAFLRRGYTVVLPDYIKHPAPQARFPAHIVDGVKTIAWVVRNIERYGGDPGQIFLAGHSAGAHTVALLATDASFLRSEGLSGQVIRGVAVLAGPYRFVPDTPAAVAVFGPESNYPEMDPIRYVDGDEPPTLVLHSDADKSIASRHPRELAHALRAVDGDVDTRIYEHMSHADMVTHLHPWFAGDNSLAAEIDDFFKSRQPGHNAGPRAGN